MTKILLTAALATFTLAAAAKLPPLDDAAKAKAAEAAAKQAWQAKVDGYQLCKAQDKVVAAYRKTSSSAAKAPVAAVAPAAPAAAKAASAAAAPAVAASGTTPVVTSSAPPPCLEPGPFAYNPPEQKPLETSGAHSPTGTAASPPSVKPNSAQMAPATAKK